MKKVKVEIPTWYLSDDEKYRIQRNSENLAKRFREAVHKDDEKLKRIEKMHHGDLRIF